MFETRDKAETASKKSYHPCHDQGDGALLHLEPKATVEAEGLNLSEVTGGSLL